MKDTFLLLTLFSLSVLVTWSTSPHPLGRAVLQHPSRAINSHTISLTKKHTVSSERTSLDRFTLAHSLNCAPRDLRVIDPKYAGRSNSAFLMRKDCVVLRVGHVRAVVTRDSVVVFLGGEGSGKEEVVAGQEFLVSLEQHLQKVYDGNNPANNPANNKSNSEDVNVEIENNSVPTTLYGRYRLFRDNRKNNRLAVLDPSHSISRNKIRDTKLNAGKFPLVVIEAILGHVTQFNSRRANEMTTSVSKILGDTSLNQTQKREGFLLTQSKLSELLPMKNRVDRMESECQDLHCAINDVLKNDEDMDLLAGICGGGGGHDDVEMMFEDYLLQFDEVLTAVRDCTRDVKNSEEIMEIELDLLRNRILRFEMLIEITGLVVAMGAAVTGLFGMNLISYGEDHKYMFYIVTGVIVIMTTTVGAGLMRQCKLDKIL